MVTHVSFSNDADEITKQLHYRELLVKQYEFLKEIADSLGQNLDAREIIEEKFAFNHTSDAEN